MYAKVGALALEAGLVSKDQLEAALASQSKLGKKYRLGEVLVGLGYLRISEVMSLLSNQGSFPVMCEDCRDGFIFKEVESNIIKDPCPNCGGALTVVPRVLREEFE